MYKLFLMISVEIFMESGHLKILKLLTCIPDEPPESDLP
jgi:hypothetical protein